MRLAELVPKVLSSFVRNRLISEVYLPLVGANLAKQIGALGAQKRTDRMGLLFLVSPPGYGKTTLMEYVASVLGLVFVKVNGPALGHDDMAEGLVRLPNVRYYAGRIRMTTSMSTHRVRTRVRTELLPFAAQPVRPPPGVSTHKLMLDEPHNWRPSFAGVPASQRPLGVCLGRVPMASGRAQWARSTICPEAACLGT